MALIDEFLTVYEATQYLRLNGFDIGEIYLRILIGTGRIRSQKMFGNRLVSRKSLAEYVEKRLSKR